MKPVKIEQLFQAAKTAPASVAEPMPEILKTRILARWGRGDAVRFSAIDLFPNLRLVFRIGLGFAVAVMLGCLAWSYQDLTYEPETYLDVATISANADLEL